MSSIKPVRIVCAILLTAIANSPPAFAQVQAVVDLPAGWSVSAGSTDPALAELTEEQLIDRLRDTEPTVRTRAEPTYLFWGIGGVVNFGGGSVNVPVNSPAAVELVRRGWRALPALLAHLTDARPTKLVYAVPKPVAGRQAALAFGDDYDPRIRGAANATAGVNTGERTPLDDRGTYTFRIGELCYAVLGQIVNRDLRAVRCGSEDAMIFSGSRSSNPGDWFKTINSPIVRPGLAAAARADWGGLTAQALGDSLRDDFQRPVPNPPKDRIVLTSALYDGALPRLLFYYPSRGLELAEARLRRTLTEPIAGFPGNPPADGSTVDPWEQSRFVTTLAPFHADRLQAALLDLFRRAAARAEADLRMQPEGTWDPSVPSLGSDLALVCAKRLIHKGHDDELKAFFTARVAAIEVANKSADPAPGKNLGAAKYVNQMQADECRNFLAELGQAAAPGANPTAVVESPAVVADARVRLGPLSLERQATSLTIRVAPIEPSPERIFVGRVIIDQAKDDVGVTLWQEHVPMLQQIAVGRTSEAEMRGLPKAAFEAVLTRASPQAKTLTAISGRVELVVSDFDPDSVVVVKDIDAKFGSTIESKALQAANVSIAISNRGTADGVANQLAAQNEAKYGETARLTNRHMFPTGYEAGDVALAMSDPDGRFLNVEFRDAAGQSLRYNHNGWSHSSSGPTRFDVYRLGAEVPPGTQMVVWLRTQRSFLIVPLKAANVPLPEEAASAR
jgi:hypothetical protein